MGTSAYISLDEIIRKAINFEELSARFYHDLQSKTDVSKNIMLLEMLEKQEWEHKETLERLKEKENLDIIRVQFPPDFSLTMPVLTKEDPSFEEILDLAIKREIVSAEIYDRAAEATTGYIQDVLSGLAKYERVHERSLKELKHQ